MKPTIQNRIKLWWHCLIHFHQDREYNVCGEVYKIECYNCAYGKEE